MIRRALAALCIALGAGAVSGPAQATRYCDAQGRLSAEQKDTIFRFGAVIKAELDKSGATLVLISRSGLDLSRFQVRYSHAGVSLKASPEAPWAVRQLYFACDEGRPLIFDQGMLAFLMGTDEPALGYVSVVLLPPAQAAELERAALDRRQALQLLATTYSANAYPYSLRYQNCNQWVMELLAAAWGHLGDGDADTAAMRAQAQHWLREQGYAPTVFDVGWRPLMWAGAFIPWLHSDDHPPEDLAQVRYQVSMPASIEAFVHATVPAAERIEFCHAGHLVVVRRGWEPIAEGCKAGAQDTLITLD